MNPKNAPKFYHLNVCESTQDEALALSLKNNCAVIVLSDHQIKGRGRQGREWLSNQSSSLTMTLSLPVRERDTKSGFLSLLAGASLFVALEKNCHKFSSLTLKWPNDLGTFEGETFKKTAGVLIEAKKNWYLIGIGINLKGKAPWINAFSLSDFSKTKLPKTKVLAKEIASTFYAAAARLESEEHFSSQLLEFLSNKAMNQLWDKKLGRNWQNHVAHGLAADASLITTDASCKIHQIYSGEI